MIENGMEAYSREEHETIEEHIEKCFGEISGILPGRKSDGICVDIYIINPTPEHNYYTLISVGMGAHSMDVPDELQGRHYNRIELLLTLPPDWDIHNNDYKWRWPFNIIRDIAGLPNHDGGWLGSGHSVSNMSKPYVENTKLSGAMLVTTYAFGEDSQTCALPNGDIIRFYQVIFLYNNEISYKILNGTKELQNRFPQHDIGLVLDINRKNYICEQDWCIKSDDIYGIADEIEPALKKIRPLLGKNQNKCFISNRILVDGCKVGYMEREEPDNNTVALGDSGWGFYSNDEDEVYWDNSENYGIYSLSTIAIFAPDVIPYLASPYGSAFYRDKDGKFYPDDEE